MCCVGLHKRALNSFFKVDPLEMCNFPIKAVETFLAGSKPHKVLPRVPDHHSSQISLWNFTKAQCSTCFSYRKERNGSPGHNKYLETIWAIARSPWQSLLESCLNCVGCDLHIIARSWSKTFSLSPKTVSSSGVGQLIFVVYLIEFRITRRATSRNVCDGVSREVGLMWTHHEWPWIKTRKWAGPQNSSVSASCLQQ